MNPENLMNTEQQKTLYNLLKERGFLTIEEVKTIYKSDISAREFMRRIVNIGIAKFDEERPNTFIYVDLKSDEVKNNCFIEALRAWQPEYENVIPQIRIMDFLSMKGYLPSEIFEVRDHFIKEKKIKLNSIGDIIILEKELKVLPEED